MEASGPTAPSPLWCCCRATASLNRSAAAAAPYLFLTNSPAPGSCGRPAVPAAVEAARGTAVVVMAVVVPAEHGGCGDLVLRQWEVVVEGRGGGAAREAMEKGCEAPEQRETAREEKLAGLVPVAATMAGSACWRSHSTVSSSVWWPSSWVRTARARGSSGRQQRRVSCFLFSNLLLLSH